MESLLKEALADLDAEEGEQQPLPAAPARSIEATASSDEVPAASLASSIPRQPGVADCETVPQQPASADAAAVCDTSSLPAMAASSSAADSSAQLSQNKTLMREAEELAQQLVDGLSLGSANAPAAPPADASPESAPEAAAESDMEATLAALARSAETLTRQQGDDDDEGAAACLELLKQLGDGLGELGGEGMPGSGEYSRADGSCASGDGSDAAFDGLLDNLVGQLLSKDVMLEPLRMLHEEFPRYLQAKGASLSPEDLRRYQKQQEIVGKILQAYEARPDDTDTVAQLMQEMQQYGPPPTEIAAGGGGCTVC